jgi:hypothetical protein
VTRSKPHLLAEQRSLDLHREVATRIRLDPGLLERARAKVSSWRANGSVHDHYIEAWLALLAGDAETVASLLEERSERAHDLRQVSPFSFVLDPRTRWRIRRQTLARSERP